MIKPHILAAAALLAIPAAAGQAQSQDLANPDSAFAAEPEKANWQGVIAKTERGHLIGNPKAETQLIEFVSYTCGHCANFTQQGEPALDLALLMPGKMGLEVRPVIRNALDLTVTLLAQCGDPEGFKARHRAFMFSQDQWLAKVKAAPQSQQAIWARGDKASRMNAASALGQVARGCLWRLDRVGAVGPAPLCPDPAKRQNFGRVPADDTGAQVQQARAHILTEARRAHAHRV